MLAEYCTVTLDYTYISCEILSSLAGHNTLYKKLDFYELFYIIL